LPSSKKIVQVFCNELMQQLLLLSWEMSWAVAAGRQLRAVTKAWTPGVKIILGRAHPGPGRSVAELCRRPTGPVTDVGGAATRALSVRTRT
jgi:hypothetical protein